MVKGVSLAASRNGIEGFKRSTATEATQTNIGATY